MDAVGNFPGPPQRQYDPYANTYNPGWKDHPNLSYGVNPRNNQPYQNRFSQQPQGSGNFLETMVNKLAANVLNFQQQNLNFQKEMNDFQQKIEASIKELTTSIEKLTSQRKLPSQTEPNPRQNANAVTLRSEKVLEPIPDRNFAQEIAQEKPKKDEQVRPKPPMPKIQPPFPELFNQCRRGKEDKEILETFRNVEINIPLSDAFKQIPRYAKFLKELCTNKRKLTGNERVNVGVIIQLADMSVVHPEGVLEDVLVKVNELIFPADFYVIKMEEDSTLGSSDLLLGRPFFSTTSTKIDVRSGTLTMEFDGEIVKFNVCNAISHPSEILSVNRIDIIDSLVEENFE
ncbi:uncharacterized protein [Gossypium hirsutum]|uniref:Uncharacterized protein n=1 Tax=Gossypium hirsutum TaxID=3635 RepID=A0A1U8L0F9_GOSHI|nr:uncharacterized protein LOC107922555 [Gossypium hirsutum]